MSAEAIRYLNASLFALLVFVWLFWAFARFQGLRSTLVALSTATVWCVLSISAYDAAGNNGPLATDWTYVLPGPLTLTISALTYDTFFRPPHPDWAAMLKRLLHPFPFDESNHPDPK